MRVLSACGTLAVGLVLAWAAPPADAAPAPGGDAPAKSAAAEKIRKDLDRVISIDIDQQPLALAVNQITEQTKINFVIDRLVLQQMGMDPDNSPVTLKLKNVKVRSVLRTLLTPYNLNFAIVGETVVITNDDMATVRQMKQRVSVDFEKLELARALKQLSRETATNLIVDTRSAKEAQTPLTLQLDDVPLETAVRVMAEMAGLKPVRIGNTLFITSKANANELRADPDLAPAPQQGQPGGIIIGGPGMPGGPAIVPPAPAAKAEDKKEGEEAPEKPPEKGDKGEKPEKSDKSGDKLEKIEKGTEVKPEKEKSDRPEKP